MSTTTQPQPAPDFGEPWHEQTAAMNQTMKPLLLLCLLLTSCQTIKDRIDLWFFVPKNPFEQPTLESLK